MMVGMLSRKDLLIMNKDNIALKLLIIIEKVETEINKGKVVIKTIRITTITTENLTIKRDQLTEIFIMSARIRWQ